MDLVPLVNTPRSFMWINKGLNSVELFRPLIKFKIGHLWENLWLHWGSLTRKRKNPADVTTKLLFLCFYKVNSVFIITTFPLNFISFKGFLFPRLELVNFKDIVVTEIWVVLRFRLARINLVLPDSFLIDEALQFRRFVQIHLYK